MSKFWVRTLTAVLGLLLFVSATLGGNFKELQAIGTKALEEYFLGSDRPIRQIQFGQFSQLSQFGNDYLLEAEVIAKAAFGSNYVYYHCGIFLKKLSGPGQWRVDLTTCEAYVAPQPGRP